ncbi:MAG: hypothetical protein E6K94_09325 [Thaumarchaeota archaeon]|nr:MAG: hypothetical protein E6K94_09325 [Nitrososphaerota archaeon]
MGVNLVTRVRKFTITHEEFSKDDHQVEHECVTPGVHKLLRFEFLSHNIGDKDLEIGDPKKRPDLFEFDPSHDHYHLVGFIEYSLKNSSGSQVIPGKKQSFCLEDTEPLSPWAKKEPHFTCANQGISSGWADVYPYYIPCQYVVIDDKVPNGDYVLSATCNAKKALEEDNFTDNTTTVGLRINGDTVTVISHEVSTK